MHADVHRLCLPHMPPGPMANALPGQWTGHVTLARGACWESAWAGVANRGRPSEIPGSVVGLRRWDGNAKREQPISR